MTTKRDDNTVKSLELSEGQLEVHFRRLNLAHMRRIYKEVAVRAEKESWSYRDFLALLLAEEVARRKQTRLQRCTRSAHFPFFKTIDEFDFTFLSSKKYACRQYSKTPQSLKAPTRFNATKKSRVAG
jgi:DNA replication protein DnaC